ncbi:MAG: hypothetical protein ACO3LE_09150, partial [Bdellovibrionota bacterium]
MAEAFQKRDWRARTPVAVDILAYKEIYGGRRRNSSFELNSENILNRIGDSIFRASCVIRADFLRGLKGPKREKSERDRLLF